VEYYYCSKFGHIQRNYFQWKDENNDKKDKQKEKDHNNDRVTTTTYGDLVLLSDYESVNLVLDKSMWIMIVVLHYMLHQEKDSSHLTLLVILKWLR